MQEKFYDLPLEDVLGDRFGRYSKYIIQDRALPDARDGLKPVQRRILFSMYREGNTHEKPFRKAAKTVGNVIGNYHPHGDSSVYEAMVRMSQDWKLRTPLIEMHGNNGSMDGDSPAAMRYTEARLSSISGTLLKDLDQETVDFVPNFDDSEMEPTVLPAGYPNLLVNGTTGISAGYATDIPPHNLSEVIDGTIYRLEKPTCTVQDIMKRIQGPDFPTGGIIQGVEGIKKAYETGRGKIILRSRTEIEKLKGGKTQIVITEIPFEVNKANLVKKIDEIRFDKKIEGITEVRDETDRSGLRIVIELKKEVDPKLILNYLYKSTDLQISYHFNMVAIVDKHPKLLGILPLLDSYITHQKEVVTRRSRYQLEKAHKRQHILDGLIRALSILDQVIEIIRASKDKKDAKENLIKQFHFSEQQSEAIVTLQLYRLTNTDVTELQKEAEELKEKIAFLQEILNDEQKLIGVIRKELLEVKKKYKTARLSEIEEKIEEIQIDKAAMLPQEDVIVVLTNEGYIKRTSLRSYTASGGKDLGKKEGDYPVDIYMTHTSHTLLLFTNKGNYIYLPVHELPEIRWKDMGQHIMNIVPIEKDEWIIKSLIIPYFNYKTKQFLLFATKHGQIKKTELNAYQVQRYSKPLIAINLKNDDALVDVQITDGKMNVFLTSKMGYGLTFSEEQVSPIGVRSAGVKGINLRDDDEVVSMNIYKSDEKPEFLIGTQRGAIKRISIEEFVLATRGKRGIMMMRTLKTNPHEIIRMFKIQPDEKYYFIVPPTNTFVEIHPHTLKIVDRTHNGTFIIDVGKKEEEIRKIIAITIPEI